MTVTFNQYLTEYIPSAGGTDATHSMQEPADEDQCIVHVVYVLLVHHCVQSVVGSRLV